MSGTESVINDLTFYFHLYVSGFLSLAMSVFGVITNVINILVFLRQGIRESSTLSLFSLAISDMCSLVAFGVMAGAKIAQTLWPHAVLDPIAVNILIGAYPRGMFATISILTTVYISLERSLCVARPLRFKSFITTPRTACILIFLYVLCAASYSPVMSSLSFQWRWDSNINRTRIMLHTNMKQFGPATRFSYAFNNICFGTLAEITVVTSSYILITKVRQSAAFRRRVGQHALPDTSESHSTDKASAPNPKPVSSQKDKTFTKVVVLLSIIFIACHTPVVTMAYATYFVPEFNIGRKLHWLAALCYHLSSFLASLNASVNIFIYYNLSSKFRTILLAK